MDDIRLDLEILEERIAPSLQGWEGSPGHQGGGGGSNGSVPNGATPQPNG